MAESVQSPDIDWLYPDMLSKEGLVHILKHRYIKHSNSDLENLEKEQLVELYNHFILPLPQRKYKNNRRGRDMTKKQIIMNRKRKRIESSDDTEQPTRKKGMTEGPSSGLINQFNLPNPTGTRLKPPPSCINFEKKVVRLSSSKKTDNAASVNNSTEVANLSKKLVKLTATNTSPVTEKSSLEGKDILQRKRPNHNSTNDSHTNSAGDSGTSKKKFSKITWP